MKIEQLIIDSVMLTEKTGIPVLFLSNPGLGKTTILKRYASKKGYHLETLIGSRFSPEEISGYQVNNGGDHLTHMSPEWYSRIMAKSKEGITTLLFIDEISTCSEAVQGALLSLIFDRTIGSEKFLPEDCVIVSAANYANNLPSCMNIMAPTLNRFALINLNENYKAMDMLNEFIDEPKENELNFYTPNTNLPENFQETFKKNYKEAWNEIFLKYSDTEAALGYLDISNRNLDGLYSENEYYVYNFISGRTISYLCRMLIAYVQLGMNNETLLFMLIDGLVGAGTCTFIDKKQAVAYRKFIHKIMKSTINKKEEKKVEVLPLQNDIIKDVQAYLINTENTGFYHNDNITQVLQIIDNINKTLTIEKVIDSLNSNEKAAYFAAQMEAVLDLHQAISQYPDTSNTTKSLTKTAMDFYGLYCDIMGTQPNIKDTFGCKNPLFERVVFVMKKDAKGRISYARAALRKGQTGTYPSLYMLKKEQSLDDATLKAIVHDSDGLSVIYWNKGFKTMPTGEYVRSYKK